MKTTKRIVSLCLCLMLAVCLFAGCESEQDKIDALAGVYVCELADTQEQAEALAENVDLYEEELALVDMNSLKWVKLVEFRSDKTYRFSCDVEATKECVRDFYVNAFKAFYENRTQLNEVYEVEFDDATEEEFLDFYAAIYELESFDALIEAFVENAYVWDELAADSETGTYRILGKNIMCTITGETEAEALGYELNATALKLIYSDGTEDYIRKN